jgi:hypothetical protein
VYARRKGISLYGLRLLGILSAYVIVVVVVVVVDVVYAIRVYGPFFLSRLSYRLADITDVFLRTIVTDRQQKKGKERERERKRGNNSGSLY